MKVSYWLIHYNIVPNGRKVFGSGPTGRMNASGVTAFGKTTTRSELAVAASARHPQANRLACSACALRPPAHPYSTVLLDTQWSRQPALPSAINRKTGR